MVQCLSCIKAGLPVHFSWFCSDACLISAWPTHRQMHAAAATRQKEAQMKAQQSGPKGAVNNGNKFKPTEWHVRILTIRCVSHLGTGAIVIYAPC